MVYCPLYGVPHLTLVSVQLLVTGVQKIYVATPHAIFALGMQLHIAQLHTQHQCHIRDILEDHLSTFERMLVT